MSNKRKDLSEIDLLCPENIAKNDSYDCFRFLTIRCKDLPSIDQDSIVEGSTIPLDLNKKLIVDELILKNSKNLSFFGHVEGFTNIYYVMYRKGFPFIAYDYDRKWAIMSKTDRKVIRAKYYNNRYTLLQISFDDKIKN